MAIGIVLTPLSPPTDRAGDPLRPRVEEINPPAIAAGSTPALAWKIRDVECLAIYLAGKALRLVFSTQNDPTGEYTPVCKYETGSGLAVTGADSSEVSAQLSTALTGTIGRYRYWLWNVTDDVVIAEGWVDVVAASKDVTA